jgi:hypothetical protein
MALMHGDRPNKHGGGERFARAGWEPEPQHHWQPMHNPDGSQGVVGCVNRRVRSSLDASCNMNQLDIAV